MPAIRPLERFQINGVTVQEKLGFSGPPRKRIPTQTGAWELVMVLPAQDYDGLRPIAIYRPAAKVEPSSD